MLFNVYRIYSALRLFFLSDQRKMVLKDHGTCCLSAFKLNIISKCITKN